MTNNPAPYKHHVYSDVSQLPEDILELLSKAKSMTDLAYAPYSNFLVGAAVLLENGEHYGGCNQENASYPLCICAERVALYSYGAAGVKTKIKALAITAFNTAKPLTEPCMPCGACRQVIQEFEHRQDRPIDLYVTANNLEAVLHISGIGHILPSAFSYNDLI